MKIASSCKGSYSPHVDHPSRDMDDKPKRMPKLKSMAKMKKAKK